MWTGQWSQGARYLVLCFTQCFYCLITDKAHSWVVWGLGHNQAWNSEQATEKGMFPRSEKHVLVHVRNIHTFTAGFTFDYKILVQDRLDLLVKLLVMLGQLETVALNTECHLDWVSTLKSPWGKLCGLHLGPKVSEWARQAHVESSSPSSRQIASDLILTIRNGECWVW